MKRQQGANGTAGVADGVTDEITAAIKRPKKSATGSSVAVTSATSVDPSADASSVTASIAFSAATGSSIAAPSVATSAAPSTAASPTAASSAAAGFDAGGEKKGNVRTCYAARLRELPLSLEEFGLRGEEGVTAPLLLGYPDSRLVVVELTADGFLKHMVRRIVGALREVGNGRRAPDEMFGNAAGREPPAVPARGLWLDTVWLDDQV